MMIVDVQAIGSSGPSGIHHQLWVSEPKARKKTKVVARCNHSDAEKVFATLVGDSLDCDAIAGVAEHLLRRRIPFEEALDWAALPIFPSETRHLMHLLHQSKGRWTLADVYRWHSEHLTPAEAARRYILPPTAGRSG